MTHIPHPVGAGYFARLQIYCRDPFITGNHRRRFRTVLAPDCDIEAGLHDVPIETAIAAAREATVARRR